MKILFFISYDWIILIAIDQDQLPVLKLILSWDIQIYRFYKAIYLAAEKGQFKILKFLKGLNPRVDISRILFLACKGYRDSKGKMSPKWVKIFHLIRDWNGSSFGTNDLNLAFQLAVEDNKIGLMKLFRGWTNDLDLDTAMIWAAENNQLLAIELLEKWGANNYKTAKSRSIKHQKFGMIRRLRLLIDTEHPNIIYGETSGSCRYLSEMLSEFTYNQKILKPGELSEWQIVYWECMSLFRQWENYLVLKH